SIRPPKRSTTCLTTARPSPVPRSLIVKNTSNSRARTCPSMPWPVSAIVSRTHRASPAWWWTRTRTCSWSGGSRRRCRGSGSRPPPPLRAAPPVAPEDPNTRTYYLEAWMPEQVAVMKVQGFVDSATGEVVTSIPGLMRVRLLDPHDLVTPARPGLLGWLGFVEQAPPRPRVLAVMDFHLQHKETTHQKRLAGTLKIRPGDDVLAPARWRAYCDKLFCDVRAFLMGLK